MNLVIRSAGFIQGRFGLLLFVVMLLAAEAIAGENTFNSLSNRADVLIVTSAELEPAFAEFAQWKTKTGRPAKIISTATIDSEYEGVDIQAKIRNCCLQHIDEHGTQFVIIGGDSQGKSGGHVPDRDTDHSKNPMLPYDNIPTDLYFISPKNWDANQDGIYGSFAEDITEVSYYHPKACIGRIPVRTAKDVAAYTAKVIGYESRYPVGQFAHRMIYTCPEQHAYPKLQTSLDVVSSIWPAGRIDQFYAHKTPWDNRRDGDYPLNAENFAKMINGREAAKLHMHGHGLLSLWALERNSTVTAKTVDQLANKNAYPIITTVSCLTGQYDNEQDPCIAESMIRQADAGAIAVLAPSREGVPFMLNPEKDFRLMMTEGKMDGTTSAYTKFWSNALSKHSTIGEAFKQVKMDMESDARKDIGFHMVQCELNLLGDPTIDPRPTPPTSFRGRASIRDGRIIATGFSGAKLCVTNGDDFYEIVEAENSRTTIIDLRDHVGTFSVAAYGPGYNTWIKENLKLKTK